MKLLVIDGNSLLNRAFYGIKLLTTKQGLYTNGVYGFYNILNKLLSEVQPDAAAAAFDLKAPTFRHKAYDGYKAGRHAMPEELAAQVPLLKQLLDLLGIHRLEAEGFEADDILGTLAAACTANGDECVLATGDRDSLQLVGENVRVFLASTKGGRPETTVYDIPKIREVYGIAPPQLIDVKALMGDASDKIPGVPGVGEKTALSLIQKHGSFKGVYASLDAPDIRPLLRKKLEDGKALAEMSLGLARIVTNAPVETELEKLRIGEPDRAGLYELLRKLEFYSVIEKLGLRPGEAAEPAAEAAVPGKAILDAPAEEILRAAQKAGRVDFYAVVGENGFSAAGIFDGDGVYALSCEKDAGFAELLKNLFEDEKIEKRTHDVKRVFSACVAAGIEPRGKWFDTMLAGYILDPLASSYTLGRLSGGRVFPVDAPEEFLECVENAAAIHALADGLAEKLENNGQHRLYYDVEIPLARVLADMETAGFAVDKEGIVAFGGELETQIAGLQKEIYTQVGYEFNLNSPKQLGEALFVKLGLPAKKKTKTGYSTNAEVLEGLRGSHPVIEHILNYRLLAKLKSTYTDGLVKVISPDGRIHTSFNQTETRTGRISSTEPNLQNIPVRSELGREMRKFFVAKDGWVLVDADYSQIELRILAAISDDPAMQAAFENHEDIHAITASQVFNIPLPMVTPLMRSRAKAVNFGIVYGIGAFSLSRDIGVSVREADAYIKGYLEKFSGVARYMEKVVADARQNGYVETLLGRRRSLPELAMSNHNMRAFGERVARNTPIQGTAADVIKIAMVRVHNRLKAEEMKSRLILQVHDELIVEAPEDEADAAAKIVKQEMESAMTLKVKLEAEVHRGKTWFEAKA